MGGMRDPGLTRRRSAGVAAAAVDRGGGVLALLSGQAFRLGERIGQVRTQLGVVPLEGGYPFGLAAAEGLLPCSRRRRHDRRLPTVTNRA